MDIQDTDQMILIVNPDSTIQIGQIYLNDNIKKLLCDNCEQIMVS